MRLSSDGQNLTALDDAGGLVFWNRITNRARWWIKLVGTNPVTQAARTAVETQEWPFPLPLQRIGTVALIPNDNKRVIAATREMTTYVWDIQEADGRTRLKAGANPRILFDENQPELLWALGGDGDLRVFDVSQSDQIDQITAHSAGRDLTILTASNQVLTVGDDGLGLLWQVGENRKIVRGEQLFNHDRPLLGISASHNGKWIAGVDDTARLVVWDGSGDRVFVTEISKPSKRPLTGRVAFSRHDSYLAAFGAGAECAIYSTNTTPFEKLACQPELAGSGGTALLWNRRQEDYLLVTDSFRRYQACEISNCLRHGALLNPPNSVCVAMTQTPNGNRWLLLEKSGRLLFHDPHIAGELVDWDMGPGPVCDIAVDRKSERVAVASADGQITVLETQPSDRVPSVITKDESKRWLSTSLFEDDTAKALTSPRAAVIGQDYRAAALVLRERDSRKELVYVAETPGGTIEEIIQADGLSDVRTIGLTLDSFNCPVAVYRCQGNETTEGKTYLADLRIARRSATRNWNKQTITKNQNVGHFPIPIVRDGQISDIFHFDYGTMSWKRTYADGDIWRQKMVGRFGDGFGAFGISDRHGNAHFIFRPNRVGSDGGPNFYARWNGAELQREVVDPAAEELLGVATTDASVYVLLRRPGLAGTKKHFIAKRNVNGQWTYEKLPFPHLLDVSLAIGRAGRIFVVGWSADACQLALFVKNQNQWTRSVLEEFPGTTDQQLRWAIVQVDSPTRPVIMVGGFANDTARRWIRVYRLAD